MGRREGGWEGGRGDEKEGGGWGGGRGDGKEGGGMLRRERKGD